MASKLSFHHNTQNGKGQQFEQNKISRIFFLNPQISGIIPLHKHGIFLISEHFFIRHIIRAKGN